MKKIIFIALALLAIQNAFAKKVKFTVNMTGQANSALGIHVMGDFQAVAGYGPDWTPNSCLMVVDPSDTDIFHFVVDIPAFTKYEYKYVNGDQSYEVEVIPLESQVGYNFDDNRWIYIDSLDADTTELAPFVFGANAPTGLNMIRFLVDMTTTSTSSNGVHVAGNFQSNNPATDRLYSFQNNVYEIISYMTLGNYTYKYYNGNVIANAETVPGACATAGDRTINLTKDTVLGNLCFSSCSTCYPTFVTNAVYQSSIKMYPNPMHDYASIQFNDASQFHNIIITDLAGRLVKKQLNIQERIFKIEHSNFCKGVYTVCIENESGVRTTQKLIIE